MKPEEEHIIPYVIDIKQITNHDETNKNVRTSTKLFICINIYMFIYLYINMYRYLKLPICLSVYIQEGNIGVYLGEVYNKSKIK